MKDTSSYLTYLDVSFIKLHNVEARYDIGTNHPCVGPVEHKVTDLLLETGGC